MNISKLYAAPFFVDHHAHDHTHDPGVSSVSIVCEGEMDLEKASLELFLISCYISQLIK